LTPAKPVLPSLFLVFVGKNFACLFIPSLGNCHASTMHPPRLDEFSAFPRLLVVKMSLARCPDLWPMETAAMAMTTSTMDEELQHLSACSVVVYPEDFLIVFQHQNHRATALKLGRLCVNHTDINICIKPWCILPYNDLVDLRYHVCICLEGIPAHAWNESIARER
jgi:hypothetical protein